MDVSRPQGRTRGHAFSATISRRNVIVGPDGTKAAVRFGHPYRQRGQSILIRVHAEIAGTQYSGIFSSHDKPVQMMPVQRPNPPTTFS